MPALARMLASSAGYTGRFFHILFTPRFSPSPISRHRRPRAKAEDDVDGNYRRHVTDFPHTLILRTTNASDDCQAALSRHHRGTDSYMPYAVSQTRDAADWRGAYKPAVTRQLAQLEQRLPQVKMGRAVPFLPRRRFYFPFDRCRKS